MIIQFNTDKTIAGDQRHQEYFTSQIEDGLKRFKSHLTRIEVHLSDQNGKKEGIHDILCVLEARLEGSPPVAVSHKADTVEKAVSGGIQTLKSTLDKILDRMTDH
jgi:hypothetical protein